MVIKSYKKINKSLQFFYRQNEFPNPKLRRLLCDSSIVVCLSLANGFQYGFRSSRSTADLFTVVSDRIARAFNRSRGTRAVAHDISKAFDRVWHAGLLQQKSYGISGQIFDLISCFLSDRRLRVALDGKS